MRFESLLVFILFKFKKRPNISEIRVVVTKEHCIASLKIIVLLF